MENEYDFKEKITYKIGKATKDAKNKDKIKLKIFGEEFVKNNKSNFKIIFEEEELDLTPYLEVSKDKKTVEIILEQINPITDLSNMFSGCLELSFPNLSKLNTEQITNISNLFKNCGISQLPDISNWNTSHIKNMSGVFSGCKLLKNLPDISKWDISQVTDLSFLFYGCSSFGKLPDLSNWDTSNVKNMKQMFEGCSILKQLPEIDKWIVKEVKNMSHMFYGCFSLLDLPDISKWDISKVTDMSMMFYNCSGLNSLPDLDKWNVSSLKTKFQMFTGCKPTLNFPAFLKLSSQYLENVDKSSVIRAETQKNIKKPNINILNNIDTSSLEKFYSKNYLCCYNCQGIPEVLLLNNKDVLLSCEFCGISDKVKLSEIIEIKSKWIKRIFFKCSAHKNDTNPYASHYCKSCDVLLCKECKENHIDNSIENQKHELEYIYDVDTIICEKHSSKSSNYCFTCNTYICNTCIENEHKSHDIKEKDENDKLQLIVLQNFYRILEKAEKQKIDILKNLESSGIIQILFKDNFFKKDFDELIEFKKFGKILFFSSKKIKQGELKEEIINNYYDLFNYICDLFNQENMELFRKSIQGIINEKKIKENNLSEKEKESLQKNISNTFTPIDPKVADIKKKKQFIKNNIEFSRMVKKYIIIEKSKNPDNYINIDETLNNLDKVLDGINSNSPEFILSLIGKCGLNNGTDVYISKNSNEDFKNLELASMQSFFSLGTQNKYELHFDFGEEENENILNSPKKQKEFLRKYKKIISSELKINKHNLIFKDVHRGSLGVSSLPLEESEKTGNAMGNLEGKFNIKKVEEKPLLETLQISPKILDEQGNRFSHWGINEKRGGEDYIPPEANWRGYGLKVLGLYDNGNNDWLDYQNKQGEFAIAYMGINNVLGKSSKMIEKLNIYSKKVKSIEKKNSFMNDLNVRRSGSFIKKDKYKTCGSGVYLFQNPEYAENYAGIINISGYQVKVILMCRVNPKKIRQPENFKECWILNPTPDEIRPYRILIKIVPVSPLTDSYFLTVTAEPVDYILDLFGLNDFSFYKYKKDEKYKDFSYIEKQDLKNDKFVLRIYSADLFYKSINGYLRDKTNLEKEPELSYMPLEHIKSCIFCIQESLRKNKSVKDDTIVYRGITKYRLPKDLGIGSKFYFREFISTSRDREQAEKFIDYEGNIRKGTLLIIKLKNNSRRNYCFDICNYSCIPSESEILISSFCNYMITGIERNENGFDIVNLDCEGFLLDGLVKRRKIKK